MTSNDIVDSTPAVSAAAPAVNDNTMPNDQGSKNPPQNIEITGGASYKVKSIKIGDDITTVTIDGTDVGKHINVKGGVFTNNGNKYEAIRLGSRLSDGTASIFVSFPFSEELKDASMTLEINESTVPFDLSKNNPEPTGAKSSDIIKLNSSSVGDMNIYIDGK